MWVFVGTAYVPYQFQRYFFFLVRYKNGTALMGLQKCWGDRKEGYGAFLIQE